jgi:hypothetical protein
MGQTICLLRHLNKGTKNSEIEADFESVKKVI